MTENEQKQALDRVVEWKTNSSGPNERGEDDEGDRLLRCGARSYRDRSAEGPETVAVRQTFVVSGKLLTERFHGFGSDNTFFIAIRGTVDFEMQVSF